MHMYPDNSTWPWTHLSHSDQTPTKRTHTHTQFSNTTTVLQPVRQPTSAVSSNIPAHAHLLTPNTATLSPHRPAVSAVNCRHHCLLHPLSKLRHHTSQLFASSPHIRLLGDSGRDWQHALTAGTLHTGWLAGLVLTRTTTGRTGAAALLVWARNLV